MTFRIQDTVIIVEAGITQQERDIIAPGKQCTFGQVFVCNPLIAEEQRSTGLDPGRDTSFFSNPTGGPYRISDIFSYDIQFVCDVLTENNYCIGEGANFTFCQSASQYGDFVAPTNNNSIVDGQGNEFTLNSTNLHYCLVANLVSISGEDGARLNLDHGSGCYHQIGSPRSCSSALGCCTTCTPYVGNPPQYGTPYTFCCCYPYNQAKMIIV